MNIELRTKFIPLDQDSIDRCEQCKEGIGVWSSYEIYIGEHESVSLSLPYGRSSEIINLMVAINLIKDRNGWTSTNCSVDFTGVDHYKKEYSYENGELE